MLTDQDSNAKLGIVDASDAEKSCDTNIGHFGDPKSNEKGENLFNYFLKCKAFLSFLLVIYMHWPIPLRNNFFFKLLKCPSSQSNKSKIEW